VEEEGIELDESGIQSLDPNLNSDFDKMLVYQDLKNNNTLITDLANYLGSTRSYKGGRNGFETIER
jgi:hypothetical protein